MSKGQKYYWSRYKGIGPKIKENAVDEDYEVVYKMVDEAVEKVGNQVV